MLRRSFGARVIALVAGVCLSHVGVSQAAAEGCAGAAAVPVDGTTQAQATHTVLCLVNRRRAAHRLRRLRLSEELSLAARDHSDDMVARTYFAHDGPAGDTLRTRVRSSGYTRKHPAYDVGEALAWGQFVSPGGLVAALMRSAVHRRILLTPGGRDLGIGLTLGAPTGGILDPSSTLVLDIGS
ncbi:MAG: hypothetical protein QOD69_283 [Solirubrobacteraceae bacterium]|jgi:uncharacterized protein YkwD|nr:hypothetical protein [Solirubrobacteraceae bacterium]